MDEADPIEVNLPFQRLPHCACDPGHGEPPSRAKKMECELRGGPCSPRHHELYPEAAEPAQPE